MKKKQGILKYTETLVVVVIWLAVLVAPLFIFQEEETIYWQKVSIAWMGVAPFLILFLINHFLLVPLLLFKNRKAAYYLGSLALVILFSFMLNGFERAGAQNGPPNQQSIQHRPPGPPDGIGPGQRGGPPPGPQQRRAPLPFPPLLNTFILSVLIIGFDTGLRTMVRWSNLEQEKTLLEKENVQNQLAFLQNQVSPHFFMNTLNNIHALIDVDTEEAKDAIIKLSKLMRHLLYDSRVERVPLTKEVEFIQSYMNLMKLRFSEKVKIDLSVPEDLPDKSIPPLLFTSFVENAFKHGVSYQHPSFIAISFAYEPGKLRFEIKNSNPGVINEHAASGIGLENSRRRLNLLYGDSFSLNIEDKQDEYNLILTIPV